MVANSHVLSSKQDRGKPIKAGKRCGLPFGNGKVERAYERQLIKLLGLFVGADSLELLAQSINVKLDVVADHSATTFKELHDGVRMLRRKLWRAS